VSSIISKYFAALHVIFCGFSTTLSPPLAARQLQLGENHNGMVFKPYNET
jgi:hypothetical protein